MRTVCVVITARPSYARVRTVIEGLQHRGDVSLHLVVAASALLQKYGKVIDIIRRDFPRVAITEVYSTLDGDTHGTMVCSAAHLATHLTTVFSLIKPDVVLTIADRYETLGTAMAASYMNIPLAHLQGGEHTGSIDDKVRNAVTQLADVHFVSTVTAARNVRRMLHRSPIGRGLVMKVGCPSIDLAAEALKLFDVHRPFDPFEKYGGIGPKIDVTTCYAVVMQHPVTTHAETARQDMLATLMAVRDMGLPAFIFWPNVDTGSDAISKLLREFREQVPQQWHFFRHLEAPDFLQLLLHAEVLIGNSSVGIRECSFLGVPVVNVGDRQQGRERGPNVLDCAPDHRRIFEAAQEHFSHGRPKRSTLYGEGNTGEAVAQLLATVPL